MPPFAAPHYRLEACELRVMHDTAEARVLRSILAGLDPWRTLRYTADALERYLLRPDTALYRYTVVSRARMIGVVCVRYPWLRGAYLELIGLDAASQGLGIGGTLLRWLEDQARLESSNVWVLVSAFNTRARMFYARHGFTEIGTLKDFIHFGSHEILLRKAL